MSLLHTSPFSGVASTKFVGFADVLENTILLTEISDSETYWLESRELDAAAISFKANGLAGSGISSVRWR